MHPSTLDDPKLVTLAGQRLQVIVKLANIILTPERPEYPGGAWHIEGMENEKIVASGIYYYGSRNISESYLAFRQAVREPERRVHDKRSLEEIYGLQPANGLNQLLGSVETKENRCIAFPNMFQHQVQPFKLVDPKKSGYRKILVFFLVNPGETIVSTATVPPQQRHWLPDDLLAAAEADFPYTMEVAKSFRDALMEVRYRFVRVRLSH